MQKLSSSNDIGKYPKLRFPEFKEPWKLVRIGDVYAERSERGEENSELLSVTMTEGVKRRSDIEGKDNSSEDKSNYKVVCIGDMVYNSMRMWQGANGVSAYDGIVSPAYTVMTAKTEIVNGFFAALFKTHRLIGEFCRHSQGMTSDTWNLKYPQIETLKTYIPAVIEQSKIADMFAYLDERIEKQCQMVEYLKKYKRGVINKLINELMLQGSPCNFAELVNIQRGGSPRPIDDYITDDINGINWIKIGDVSADTLYVTKTKERIKPSGVKKSRKVQPGDLILSNSMSFGRPYIMKIDGCIHDGWLLIRDEKEMFDKKFLCYYLASDNVMSQYRRFAAGSCVSNLNSDLVGGLQIVLPPLSEQKKCAAIFEQIDLHILNSVKQYGCLCQFKQGLLQQLFI